MIKRNGWRKYLFVCTIYCGNEVDNMLKEKHKTARMSQQKPADKSGTPLRMIQNWEARGVERATVGNLKPACTVFGCKIDGLLLRCARTPCLCACPLTKQATQRQIPPAPPLSEPRELSADANGTAEDDVTRFRLKGAVSMAF